MQSLSNGNSPRSAARQSPFRSPRVWIGVPVSLFFLFLAFRGQPPDEIRDASTWEQVLNRECGGGDTIALAAFGAGFVWGAGIASWKEELLTTTVRHMRRPEHVRAD